MGRHMDGFSKYLIIGALVPGWQGWQRMCAKGLMTKSNNIQEEAMEKGTKLVEYDPLLL
jgi:hypothetical protein